MKYIAPEIHSAVETALVMAVGMRFGRFTYTSLYPPLGTITGKALQQCEAFFVFATDKSVPAPGALSKRDRVKLLFTLLL